MYDSATPKELCMFEVLESVANQIAFSLDGKTLATAGIEKDRGPLGHHGYHAEAVNRHEHL